MSVFGSSGIGKISIKAEEGTSRSISHLKQHIHSLLNSFRIFYISLPLLGKTRTPCDVVCVVDVSGSMNMAATLKDTSGNTESHGLNARLSADFILYFISFFQILDVVKHAVKTIVSSLKDQDRLAIVAFDNIAKVTLKLTEMNEKGRNSALGT